jgi:cytoskeleton protein RodZ
LPSFGEKLRREREKRKITLDEVSSSTKIGTRMLQALEEDKFSQLPGGIFNKGFVRAYARFVGLDEEQTVADYLEASGEAPPVRPEAMGHESASDSAQERPARATPLRITDEPLGRLEIRAEAASRQLPWGWFAVILLLVALALSLWSHRRREQAREQAHEQQRSAQRPLPAKTAVQDSGARPAQPSAPSPTATGAVQTSPVSAPIKAGSAPLASVPPNQKALHPAPNPPSGAPTPVPAPDEFTLLIQAREESWISLIVDDKPAGSEMLLAGTERTVVARKQVVVRAGNAGGVDFLLNGKKLAVGGESGEVKTVTVGPAGLLTSAPAPPTTP